MADIHSKLAKIAGEIGSINKTERNKEQGFNFRSIEQITGAVRPLFAVEGVTVAPSMVHIDHSEVTSKSGTRGFRTVVHMEYIFYAGSDGSSMATSMVGEAVDYGDKSTSKAVQMAYKYALTQVLQVGSGDDPDAHSVDVGGYEERPRQRSGGRKTTPTPDNIYENVPSPADLTLVEAQARESHKTAPQADSSQVQVTLGPDVAVEVKRMKNWAFQQLGKEAVLAQAIWERVIATYEVNGDGLPHADSLGFIESDLSIAVGEALTASLVDS